MRIKEFTISYAKSDDRIAWHGLFFTCLFYGVCIAGAIAFFDNLILRLVFIVGAALGVIRIYMLQHDCGHGSFFSSHKINDVIGTVLSMVTCTPLKSLRYNHGLHHAHIGNLEQRDSSEIYTMTLQEYSQAPKWHRVGYRVYRSVFTLFILGPSLIFLLRYRWPKNVLRTGIGDTMLTNGLLLIYWGGLYAGFGAAGIWAVLGSSILGASAGAFIPYVQHNFENTYWERHPDLDFETAALHGTTVMQFGWLFDVITANIAYHDLHHLNSRIPSYRLKKCHQEMAHMLNPAYIGWAEGFASIRCKLWDEENSKMVGFPSGGSKSVLAESSQPAA